MRILFVVSGKGVPSTRFRILPYLPLLEQAGHRCDVAYSFPQKYDYFPAIGWRLSQLLKRSVRHWHAWLAQRRRYDAIVIEREVFDNSDDRIEHRLRSATKRLILDLDDGVFLNYPEKIDRLARMCDAAIGGNRWLTQYLAERCPQVELIPTCVRLSEYPWRDPQRQRQDVPRVGWIGTTQNVAFLKVAAEGLRAAGRHVPFKLVVVAPSPQRLSDCELDGVDVDFRKWDPRTEVSQLGDMDIGIMPLPLDDEWMKYKCGLKLVQYLAVGIPGIASPVGVNADILADDRVGRAAKSPEDWEPALLELLGCQSLRQQLGNAGRRLVEQSFSIEGNWQRLEGILLSTSRNNGNPT